MMWLGVIAILMIFGLLLAAFRDVGYQEGVKDGHKLGYQEGRNAEAAYWTNVELAVQQERQKIWRKEAKR